MTLLLGALQGQPSIQPVPLDIRGSAFQCKVWEALKALPAGQTRSYSEIARAIGQPTAARAVAQACATNPVAVIIPCHRVIRENGQWEDITGAWSARKSCLPWNQLLPPGSS